MATCFDFCWELVLRKEVRLLVGLLPYPLSFMEQSKIIILATVPRQLECVKNHFSSRSNKLDIRMPNEASRRDTWRVDHADRSTNV